MMSITPERIEILKYLFKKGESRTSKIALELNKKVGATSNLLSHLLGMVCIINTQYGFYEISEVGKQVLRKYTQLEDIANS